MNARAALGRDEMSSNKGGMSRLDISNISFDTLDQNGKTVVERDSMQLEQKLNLSSLRAAVAKKNISPDGRSDNSQNATVIRHEGERTGGFGTTNTTIINFPQESTDNISQVDETASMVSHSELDESTYGSPRRKTRAMRLKKKAQEISATKTTSMIIGKKPSSQAFELQYQKIMFKLDDRRPENYQYLNQLIKCSLEYGEL